jgi:hypothetical protein
MAHEGQPNDIATGNEFKLALALDAGFSPYQALA